MRARVVSPPLLLVLAAAGLYMLRFFSPAFLPFHDTLGFYQYFAYYYREYFLTGESSSWLHVGFEGVPTDYYHWSFLSPALLVVASGAKLLGLRDTVQIYSLSVGLELLVVAVGIYRLALFLIEDAWAAAFCAVAAIGTSVWEYHLLFNFRIYIGIPWILLGILKFCRHGRLRDVALLPAMFVMSMVGQLLYVTGLLLLLYTLFAAAGLLWYRPWRHWRRRPSFDPRRWGWTLAAATASTILVVAFFLAMTSVMDHTVTHATGRDPATLTVPFDEFLTYGRPSTDKPFEFVFWFPQGDLNFTCFFGTTALLLALYAVVTVHSFEAQLFKVLAFVFTLLALPAPLAVPWLAYHFPLMGYFRHLTAAILYARLFLILLAGYGFSRLTRSRAPVRDRWLRIVAGLLIAWSIAGMVHWQFFARHWQYAIGGPLVIHHLELAVPWMALALVSAGVILVSTSGVGRAMTIFFLFIALEGALYQTFMAGKITSTKPDVDPKWFTVRPFGTELVRSASAAEDPSGRDFSAFVSRWFITEALLQTFLDMDSCESYPRQNLTNRYIDDLFRARLGLPLGDFTKPFPPAVLPTSAYLLNNRSPVPRRDDGYLWAAFGCGRPRYRWADSPVLFARVETMAAAVRTAPDGQRDFLLANGPIRAGTGEALSVEQASSNRTRLRVSVTDPAGAWLIDNTGYHPGWTVTIDGQRREIVRANLGFMAVHVPVGSRAVTFEFTGGRYPLARKTLELGVRVTLVACLIFGLVSLVVRPSHGSSGAGG